YIKIRYKQFTLKLNLINLIAYNNAVHTYRDNLYAYLPPHKLAYRKCKNEAKMIQAARIIESSVYKTQFELCRKTILVHTNRHNSYAHLPPRKPAYRKCKNKAKMIQAARIIKSSVYKTQFEKIQLNIRFNLKTCFNLCEIKSFFKILCLFEYFKGFNNYNLKHVFRESRASFIYLRCAFVKLHEIFDTLRNRESMKTITKSLINNQHNRILKLLTKLITSFINYLALINLNYKKVVHTYRHNLYAHLPPHKLTYKKCKNEAKMIQAARIMKSSVYKTQFEKILCLFEYFKVVYTYRDNLYAHLPQHKPTYRKCKNEAKMIQAGRIVKSSVYKTQKFCAFDYSKVKLCIHTETIYMPHLPLHKPTYRKCKNEAKMIQAARIIKSSFINCVEKQCYLNISLFNEAKMIQAARIINSSVYKTQFELCIQTDTIYMRIYHHIKWHIENNEAKMIQAARIIKSSVYKTQFESFKMIYTSFLNIIVRTNRHNLYAHLIPHKMAYRKCKNEAKMIQAARIIKSSVYKTQFEKNQLNIRFNLKTCFNLSEIKILISSTLKIKKSFKVIYKLFLNFVICNKVVHTNRHNLYAHLPPHKMAYRKCKNETKMIQAARIINSSGKQHNKTIF
uniref:Uncharacterized protein n=1 Tax=Strongyloides stercoralis TaxID=6248 RepID=A0AAF5I3V7_STRER